MKSIMLKILSAIISILYILYPASSFAEKPEVVAEAAILIDAETGQILFEKNAHKLMYPASTTKILTCIIALEETELNEKVIVDDKTPVEVWGGHIALEAGEEFTMDQLLNGLMLNSANDTGMAIARHISGSIEGFADLMNKRAKEMGALNSNFRNPHGLPDKEHTTTAYDLAFIAKYAMKNEQFRSYVSKVEDTIPVTNKKDEPRYLMNSNKMLYSDMEYDIDGVKTPVKYEGITGIKTGYTDDAMQCLVSSAKRGDKEYIAVVLKTSDNGIYADSHLLLNYAFNSFDSELVAKKDDIVSVDTKRGKVNAILSKDITFDKEHDTNGIKSMEITHEVEIDPDFKDNYVKGDKIGKISYFSDGNKFDEAELYAENDSIKGKVSNISKTDFSALLNNRYTIILFAIIGLFILLLIIKGIVKRIRRNIYKKRSR